MKIPTIGSPEIWRLFAPRMAKHLKPRLGRPGISHTLVAGSSASKYTNPLASEAEVGEPFPFRSNNE